MFANPIWSILIIAGLIALYAFVIRPRLKVAFSETYLHIDGWRARQFARLHAFRSWVATVIAGLLIALPDIIVAVLPVDLSWLIGENWAKIVTGALAAYLAINRAFATKPDSEKA
jgi:hypothetical protein